MEDAQILATTNLTLLSLRFRSKTLRSIKEVILMMDSKFKEMSRR